ncbi:MAG: Gfo/Idh/MocA family oxidoreductase, partial [Armatimonadetes bacterium]|nr:Gfo/Idh/MocA family oxidoreductase [Armatimonadota bacterium]
ALDAGCHVIVEKPVAVSAAEVEEMIAAPPATHTARSCPAAWEWGSGLSPACGCSGGWRRRPGGTIWSSRVRSMSRTPTELSSWTVRRWMRSC